VENASYKNLKPAIAYDKSWNYSDEAVARLCEIISINHKETSQEYKAINILDIGIGTGSLSIKITERLSRDGNNVLLHGFDISEHMIHLCKQRAEDCRLKDSVVLAIHDASDITEIPDFINKTKYDVIIITFVLHYLDGKPGNLEGLDFEWKEIIAHYSGKLRDKGLLIQAEVIGDMAAVDGLTPVEDKLSNREFARVWKNYFDLRKGMVEKEWKPNIRPSSYYNVFKWINKDNSKLGLWQYAGFTCKHEQIVSATFIVDWIKTGQFSSLSVGLNSDQRQSLAEVIKQEINGKDYPITLDCRFVIHQKTGSINDFIANRFASFCEYKRKADQVSFLPLKDNRLPIKGNKLDPEIDGVIKIVNSLNQFLEECILPLSSCTFLDCELTIYDFIRNESSKTTWASVAIVRPEFSDRRESYTQEIGRSKSFVEILYESPIWAGTIVRIKSTRESAKAEILSNEGGWTALKGSRKETESSNLNDGINSHKALSSDPKQAIYTYYITTLFANRIGIGGIILVTETEIDDRLPELVQIFASDVVNPIGASYLKEEHTRQIGLSARAAVFARNFSHITGSHVISNPEFRNSLAGYHYVHGLRRRLDETYSNFLRAENGLIEYITQDPYRAEDLWTQGTKALADARDKLGTGDVFQENTRRFHEYLQGRFDFIARAIDDTQDPPEPVWFVRDLLEGFLRQTAYLDNLVADVGLRIDNMEFNVIIQDQAFCAQLVQPQAASEGRFDRQSADLLVDIKWKNAIGNRLKKSIYEYDQMIALPGGLVAAHAFYSLLENIIRNSAKYGALKNHMKDGEDGKYRISIELKPKLITKTNNSYYQLLIWDNYSSAVKIKSKDGTPEVDIQPDEQPWSVLQEKLKKTFVKSNGQPETDDLGMMEMQACSKFLCRSNSDGKYIRSKDNPDGEPSYTLTEYNLTVLPPKTNGLKPACLTYSLSVEIPILLGCLTNKVDAITSMTFYTDKEKMLLERAPFLMVIDGDWFQELNADKKEELLSRNNLPNRTLVLSASAEIRIDKRRVRACTDPGLYSSVFNTKANENENEKELILSIYRTWLQQWKRPPDGQKKWHLWVGLERQAQQVQEAWEKQANECFKFGTDSLVELMVKSYSAGQNDAFETDSIYKTYESAATNKCNDTKSEISEHAMQTPKDPIKDYWQAELDQDISHKNTLVFDNHGNCFPEAYRFEKAGSLKKSTRFYQKLSGSVSPDLFRMLSCPPQDKFSFRFFIYSLVEACLTNVVVVDERLAWSLVEGYGINESNHNFAQDLLEHQKAGIYPIFRFRQHSQCSDQTGFYNEKHLNRLQGCMGDHSKLEGPENYLLHQEGIIFDADNPANSSLNIFTAKLFNGAEVDAKVQFEASKKESSSSRTKSEDSLGIDVILIHEGAMDILLIHEGAMDILTDQMGVNWVGVDKDEKHKKQLQALYQLAPIIIRTSGRGRKSKLLGEHLPFIEFGQVSSSLLTARNKFALVRGLLGSVGRE
jgi:SAM-dependent methyltransferase